MELRYFSNNATTTITSVAPTTISVASTASFPSQYPFYVTAENNSLQREIIKVTGLASANTWNVTRAQEGTTSLTYVAGNKIELRLTAGTINSLITDKAELSGSTFTGNINVRDSVSNGYTQVQIGNSTNSGSYCMFAPNGVRAGFLGWANASQLTLASENGRNLNFDINGFGGAVKMTYSGSGLPQMYIDGKDVPRRYTSGSPLPTTDIGPIWHDDYNDWMTWQVFNQNGANYSGYASVNIGKIGIIVGIKKGYVDTGTMNLSKTTYAALWNWAVHSGYIPYTWIFSGRDWNQDDFMFKDNGDGTFRVPHMGERFLKNVNKSYPAGGAGSAYGGYFLAAFNSDDGDSSSGSYRSYTGVALQGNNGRQTYFASNFGAGGWTPDMRVDIIGNVEPKHVNASFMIKF